MRVATTLAEIASNTPSLLNGLVVSEFATARETVIRLACSKGPGLNDPPPALFHASTTPNAHVLYGGSLSAAYDDTEFVAGNHPTMATNSESVYCIGSGMVDVCTSTSRPAILYAYRKREGLVVRMVVYNCPLASMEAELFSGPPTSFERAWLGDAAKAQRALRENVYLWIRSRGSDHFPSFLYDRDQCYHTTRRGVLPFLRLRAPANENEIATLSAMLEGLEPPDGGFTTLRNLASVTAASAAEQDKLSLETIFSTHVPEKAPALVGGHEEEVDFGSEDDESKHVGCTQAVKVAALGILSLCILKQTVEDHEDGLEEDAPAPTFAQADLDKALDEEAAHPARIRGLRVEPEETPSSAPLGFAEPLLRTCGAALLVSSPDAGAAACGVMAAVASEEDAALMAEHLGMVKPGNVGDALFHVVAASPRQRFLVCYPKSKVFIMNKTSFKVDDDSARRLLLLSWVTPLLVVGNHVSEIKVKGVSRETMELSSHFKRQVILGRTMHVPESLVALMKDVSARLVALEAATKAAVVAPKGPPPPTPPPPPSPSGARRSFKRVLEMVGEYEKSLAKRG